MTSTINSKSYWEDRFSMDWESWNGREQSRFFAQLVIDQLPAWFKLAILSEKMSICDWGCAEADGTDVLASFFGRTRLTGVDFSETAIQKARLYYNDLDLKAEDWLTDNANSKRYDVVFSSNTLEHFHRPYETLEKVAKFASKLIILALPYGELDRIAEHHYTFLADNVPILADDSFMLVHAKVIDSGKLSPTYWQGQQIILIYARSDWVRSKELNLKDITLESSLDDREEQFATLNQTVVELKAQIASLNEAVAKYEGQVSSLSGTIAERNALITEIRNSTSWRLTSPLRSLSRKFRLEHKRNHKLSLLVAFAKAIQTHGLNYAISKAKRHLGGQTGQSKKVEQLLMSDQERYLMEKSAQSIFLKNYMHEGMDLRHFDCFHEHDIVQNLKSSKIIIFPLSYPRELTQRPDHILRYFSQNGYACIIISIDNELPFFKKVSSQTYLTNLFAPTINFFSNKTTVLYITYPFYSYIADHLNNAVLVYDVLDDLSVFSLNCDAMSRDHKALLDRAHITLFSSNALFEKNRTFVKNAAFLVTNGVWVNDFIVDKNDTYQVSDFRKTGAEILIGFHGAISELIDWELLEKILDDTRIHLIFIGPIIRFDSSSVDDNAQTQQRVLSSPRITHVPTVPYSQLKYYLSRFDAGIIPFNVNQKTDPVSPLKLFEYMALGLKVFATPTKTLSSYAKFITVADRALLPSEISKWIDDGPARWHSNYEGILKEVGWEAQLSAVLRKIEEMLNDSRLCDVRTKQVDIVNLNFFDWDGVTLYKGGAERYVFDLAHLLREKGWSPRIIQNANYPFEIDFRGISVVGVATECGHDLRCISKKYREVCKKADLIIASPLDLACEFKGLNVIGINHGIHWDHKSKALSNINLTEYRDLFDALNVVELCVCVDTNFINWMRTFDYKLGGKLKYVPNYVDGGSFYPVEKDFTKKIKILYPRRLYEARGIFITLKAFDYLFNKHEDIDLHLVGQASSEDGQLVSEFIARYPTRVIWEDLDMDDMCKAYHTSHIVLVPTMYSEGTSLSCLEAMATMNAVIATNVGGLPNLVIDGFNGCLIEPTAESLIEAIELLLGDRRKISEMAMNGTRLSSSFEKKRWVGRWKQIIDERVI